MKQLAAIMIFVFSLLWLQVTPAARGLEQRQLETQRLESRHFGNVRELRVLLPPSYRIEIDRRYPLLLMFDGQDLFDAADATFTRAEWRADETLNGLWRKGAVAEFILVGIDNAGPEGRASEYLPWPDEYYSPPLPDPKGELLPAFIEEEVLPFLRARYRVTDAAEETAIGGASYGGLAALYVAASLPDRFGKLLIESPSVYVHDEAMLTQLSAGFPAAWRRIYLGAGTHEHIAEPSVACSVPGNDEVPGQLARLADILTVGRERGEAPRIKRVIIDCATHHTDSYARRFPGAVKFLFPPQR